jgi:hypothetical protein
MNLAFALYSRMDEFLVRPRRNNSQWLRSQSAPLVPEIAEAISHVDTDARTHPLFQGSKQTLGREAIDQRVKTDLPR